MAPPVWKTVRSPVNATDKNIGRTVQGLFRDVIFYLDAEGYGFVADVCKLAVPMPTDFPTAYTVIEDGIFQVYMNLDFFNSLDNVSQQAYVITHELCHVLFGDLQKAEVNEDFQEDPLRFNKAADCVINDYLSENYDMDEPNDIIHGEDIVGHDCADDVVETVFKDVEATPKDNPDGDGMPGAGGHCDISQSQIVGGDAGSNDDLLKQISSVAREHGADDIADAMDEAQEGGSEAGRGYIEITGLKAESLPMNWHELVKTLHLEFSRRKGVYAAASGKVQSTFRTPDRKSIHLWPGAIAPSEMEIEGQGSRKTLVKPKVLIAIDTSGSINSQMLNRFLGVIQSLDRSKVDAEAVTFSDYTMVYDLTKPPHQNSIARGGTRFSEVLAWTRTFPAGSVDSVILITDGYDATPRITDPDELKRWLMVLDPYGSRTRHKAFKSVNFHDFFTEGIKK